MTRARDLAKGTFSGDLTVDTNTLVVDSANNNVGIGTSSPDVFSRGYTRTVGISSNGSTSLAIQSAGDPNYPAIEMGRGSSRQFLIANQAAYSTIGTLENTPLSFITNGSEAMRIDSSGRVTMPYQPAFSVYANTNETTSSGASAPFNGIIFDQGSNYSTANRRFVAPVAGIYQFSTYGNANDVSSGSPMWCAFAVNGTYRGAYMYLTVTAGGSPWMLIGGTQTIKLVANDYVEVKAGVSMHWDYGSAVWSNFSGHLVG